MMKLLGFKPASIICKEKWYFKIGQFLYPNESIIEGSTVAFKALHEACTVMKMVALCILCTRVNSRPVIVALSPCVKPLNLNIDIGFDIVNIPFVEHVRELNVEEDVIEDESLVVESAHKELMKGIINNTIIDYRPDMFEDPKLQSKYRAIEALALDEDETEPFVDTTKPSIERFQNLPDDLFEELFGPFASMTLKRSCPKVPSQQNKKPKIENFDEELFNTKLKEKKIESYTVPQLKNILKYKNIQNLPALNGLKKAELVNLVYTHCDEEK
ncbi:p70 Ku lupus autoantigen [Danaus plexippus plexippus]|uniref:P70 Ku lupus autoantigen n=1 Tax=Danaus plexippus plexippus TaxID=278856 RepID=A0A212EW55_DANPL|nr:p70 Ku lupus autoantigen [Danaus plexippus plexippus]